MINRITIIDKERGCESCQEIVRKYKFMGILKDDDEKTEVYWCMKCLCSACDVGDIWINLKDELDELGAI